MNLCRSSLFALQQFNKPCSIHTGDVAFFCKLRNASFIEWVNECVYCVASRFVQIIFPNLFPFRNIVCLRNSIICIAFDFIPFNRHKVQKLLFNLTVLIFVTILLFSSSFTFASIFVCVLRKPFSFHNDDGFLLKNKYSWMASKLCCVHTHI